MLCKNKHRFCDDTASIPEGAATPAHKSGARTSMPFHADERGTLTIFSLFLFIMIIGIMGVAVDYTRAERDRATLQHTLDRAILAAADLDQLQPPEDVVLEYFKAAGLESTISSLDAEQGINYKSIFVSADVNTSAPFLDILARWDNDRRVVNQDELVWDEESKRWLGKRKYEPLPQSATINTFAQGGAEEKVANVEISVVLDISGSMAQGNRMTNLRTAATAFVDTVLRPENDGLVSVSLVPYSQHVNVGPDIYNELNMVHMHNYSHCVELDDYTYGQTALNLGATYTQMQHFQWNYDGRNNDLSEPICPRYSYERVRPFSSDRDELVTQINQLQPRAGTQIFMGMKWAAAMLDPAFEPVVSNLISDQKIDPQFAGRPASFDDIETLKTVVLMTDGENSVAPRIADWAYNSSSEYYHWSRYNLWWYLNRHVNHYQRGQFYWEKYSENRGDQLLDNICDAAKANGIVIWSIGFEVEDDGAEVMRNCASSPSHFFRVEGIEITDAFDAIARQINQLRLTQ